MNNKSLQLLPISICLAAAGCRAAAQESVAVTPGTGRVTIFADDFEGDFPGGWNRKGNLPANSAVSSGPPKGGTHSLRLLGSPVTNRNDVDCYMQREVSTAGYRNIQVSFYMGASGM